MPQTIAHVDMDCFFAACEEKKDPSLKGKPVIVGSLPTDKRGIVSTANYEARTFGLHSAMPISRAFKQCPKGVYLRPSFGLYKKESQIIMQVLSSFGEIEQVSIDEAYVDISALVNKYQSLKEVAIAIKKEILKETGLSCSVGIAQSRYIAKIASDYKKPGGIIIVKKPREFLEKLSISKISGIGKKSVPHLHKKGMKTIGDIAALTKEQAMSTFGSYWEKLHAIARGEDTTGLREHGPRKSISKETTFQDDVDKEECTKSIERLCRILSKYNKGTPYRTVSLKVRFSDFSTITRAKSLAYYCNNYEDLLQIALDIFSGISSKKKIRLIGVRMSNFYRSEEKQMTLRSFTD